jgi:hypothetical protein
VKATDQYITLRSEAGAPVLLSDYRPAACDDLARVGSPNDGGYVVPLRAVMAADALLSFGLSHDWTFERDFKARNPKAVIHCYDHTVTMLSAVNYSVGQLLRFFLRFKMRHLKKAVASLGYPLFFRGDRIHFRQRIWRDHEDNAATIDDAFGRLPAACQVFAKMDIEGSEYGVLDDLIRHAANIVALAIEFHDVDIVPERFSDLVAELKRDFHIVHIHGNNLGGVAPFHFPSAPEITFLNKRFFASAPQPSPLSYPVAGLDAPNYPGFPDFKFEF